MAKQLRVLTYNKHMEPHEVPDGNHRRDRSGVEPHVSDVSFAAGMGGLAALFSISPRGDTFFLVYRWANVVSPW